MKAWRKYLQHRLKNPNLIIDIKALQINNKKLTLSKNEKYGQADISLEKNIQIVKKESKIIKAMQIKRSTIF